MFLNFNQTNLTFSQTPTYTVQSSPPLYKDQSPGLSYQTNSLATYQSPTGNSCSYSSVPSYQPTISPASYQPTTSSTYKLPGNSSSTPTTPTCTIPTTPSDQLPLNYKSTSTPTTPHIPTTPSYLPTTPSFKHPNTPSYQTTPNTPSSSQPQFFQFPDTWQTILPPNLMPSRPHAHYANQYNTLPQQSQSQNLSQIQRAPQSLPNLSEDFLKEHLQTSLPELSQGFIKEQLNTQQQVIVTLFMLLY